jgi:hypothetical protein
MIDLKITYKGRNYSSITDAIQKAMVDGIKETITKSLRPFETEIRKTGGQIIIDIPDNMKNMKVQLKNMPQDLIDKITKALK